MVTSPPPQSIEIGPHRPCVHCAAIWISRLIALFARIIRAPFGDHLLGGRFGYFLFFSAPGRGKGGVWGAGGGGGSVFYWKSQEGGGGGREGPRGWGGVCGESGNFLGGGGGKYFFFGAEMSSKHVLQIAPLNPPFGPFPREIILRMDCG